MLFEMNNMNNMNNIKMDIINYTNQSFGGTLIINTNYSFIKNKKRGYVFIPLNNPQKQYIVFTSSLLNDKFNKKTNIFCIVKPTNIVYKDNVFEATLDRIIGPVNILDHQIEILYHYSYQYPINIKKYNNIISHDDKLLLESFINTLTLSDFPFETYSIDPIGCTDIDDAISYLDENNIVIHIADPNRFNEIILLDKWYNNLTSIYMGNKTHHLLPKDLSTNYISLIENKVRPVISVYFNISNDNTIITKICRQNIKVNKNMTYDEANILLNNNTVISKLFQVAKKLEPIYYDTDKILKDTHDLVELFMLLINDKIGEYLSTNYSGKILYRISNTDAAKYSFEPLGHFQIKSKKYVHFSSPIRRTADYIIHQNLIECLDGKKIENKFLVNDLNEFNDKVDTIKLVSNKAKYLQVANMINNGELYKCKLLKIDNNKFRWLIIGYDIKFTCDICHETFLEQYKDFIKTLKINEIYDIKLYKMLVGKLQTTKLMFEFNLS